MSASITSTDINGLGDDLRELLQQLPGSLPAKQAFFNNRFHLRAPKTNYERMWEALGASGNVARAKYIFDYARLHLPKRAQALLAASRQGVVPRSASDPPITDLLFFDNGKPRRLGRLLASYLPTDEGKTVIAKPKLPVRPPVSSQAVTELTSTRRAAPRPARATTDTTATNDGKTGTWWRDQKRYETLRRLGNGGMGFVYLVRDRRNGRERAAKVIDPRHRKDEEYQARFFREVRAQSLLRHRNILRILDHGRDYYVCEVCTGGSVAELLAKGPPPRAPALALFRQACQAIEHAHRAKVFHRDLKPSNLLLTGDRLVVADFGLCKIDASEFTTVTSTHTRGGTFRYAAPEQWHDLKRADERADVFSLGMVLQDLLTGSTSLDAADPSALTRCRAESFTAVIARATAFNPDQRYRSVAELRRAVEAVSEVTTLVARSRSPRPRGRSR